MGKDSRAEAEAPKSPASCRRFSADVLWGQSWKTVVYVSPFERAQLVLIVLSKIGKYLSSGISTFSAFFLSQTLFPTPIIWIFSHQIFCSITSEYFRRCGTAHFCFSIKYCSITRETQSTGRQWVIFLSLSQSWKPTLLNKSLNSMNRDRKQEYLWGQEFIQSRPCLNRAPTIEVSLKYNISLLKFNWRRFTAFPDRVLPIM